MNELAGLGIRHFAKKDSHQNLLIDAVKKLFDVSSPYKCIGVGFQKFLRSFNSSKKSLFFSARPRVINKSLIKNGNEIIVNQPMNHAIADSRHGNFPLFIVTDNEFFVRTVVIIPIRKITLKFKKNFLQIKLKGIQFSRDMLAFAEVKPAPPNIS